jgi:hypothetical protein
MTANDTPSPIIITDSTSSSTSYRACARDDQDTGWFSSGASGWWKVYTGGVDWVVTSYTITYNYQYGTYPSAWTFLGSNNDVDWVTLDTISGQSFSSFEMKTYSISNTQHYTYYKINVTGNNGGSWVGFSELELIGTIYVAPPPPPPSNKVPSGDIVPRSNGFGSLGTSIKKWLNGYFYNIFATGGTISGVNMISETGETISGPVTTSAGVGDARKLTALGTDGKLSLSFMPDGVAGEVDSIPTSSGAVDAGKIPELDQDGLLDVSFFPEGIGGATVSGITTSSGVVDAGKFTKLNSIGKLDISFFPDTALSTSPYVGIVTSESLSAGDLVNIYDYGGAKCRKASAATSGMDANGYALSSVDYGSTAAVYSTGNNTSVTGLTPGQQYLSATIPGKCTSIPPSGVGIVSQKVGFATSATSLTFQREIPIVLAS